MNWNPVSESLPLDDSLVLTVTDDGTFGLYRWVEFYGRGRNGAKTWVNEQDEDSSSYGLRDYNITHWMPIPYAPGVKPVVRAPTTE